MYEADLPPFLPAHSLEETEAAEQRAKQRDADAFRSWRNLFDVIQAEFDFPGLTCTPEFPQTSYHHAVRGDAQVYLNSVCTNFDFKEPLMALLECEELLRFELDHRLKVVAGLEVTEQRQYLMGPDAEEELRAQAETALRLEQAVKFWLGASIEAGVSSTPTGYPPEFFRVQN